MAFVDVDDTLLRHVGAKSIPIPGVVSHVRTLHESGVVLYCWSTGGASYAREMAESVGIGDCFAAYLPKPNVIIDDQSVADWRQCVEVGPGEAIGRTVAEYLRLLGRA